MGGSPVEALGSPSSHPSVELWRTAAVDLTAATHALVTAREKPWLEDPAQAWHLLGDTAVSLEAVLVLDEALEQAGVLAGHHSPEARERRGRA